MGLFDDIDNEVLGTSYNNANNISYAGGLFDDIDAEIEEQELKRQQESGFANKHPFVASIPESLKQFGLRAVKSYPEFGKGLNDLFALIGDKADLPGLSSFGKGNAEFWERQSNKIQIDPRYQGLQGLKSKETFIPTVLGEIGGQATNIALSGGGAGAGAKVAGSIGAKGLAKAGLTGLGTALPNLAQEGQYLDKIQQFEAINGRLPNEEELQKIQNVALTEKGVNSALETVADVALFGKLFPQGTASKGVKNILKNAGQQFVTEAGTEGMQEGVSIGAEKLLGINQGNNLERLAESMAIGGLVGGAIGGGATAISQPYDINFPQGEAPEIAKTIYENSKKTAQDLSNYAKDVSAEIVNRINPNNYETTIEMVPQETGVGLSQRTEYVPQVKKVYRNPNLQANQEVNVTPETQVNYQDNVGNLPSNLPVNNQNLTNFIMGESGNLNTIAPKTMAKQKAKVNNPLQLTDNLYVDKKAVDTFIKDIDNIKYNKTEGNSKPSTKSSEDLSKNTNVQEKISKIAPKTAEKQNNKKEVETETIEEQIAKLEKKSQKVGGEKTKLGQKYLKQAQELRNSLKTKNANKNIDDTKGLSSEQQKQLEELNQQYEKTKANLTKEQKLSGSAYSDMQSKLKGLAMEYSAKKRQIIQGDRLEYIEGGLTTKELEAKKKQLESNYVGKKVYVNNEEAEIVGHSFGKPRVKFANGEIKTVNKEDVKNERQISTYGVVNPHKALSIIAPKTVEKQETLKGKVEKTENIKKEKQERREKKETEKPTVKYKNTKSTFLVLDENGNELYHTDGNALYNSNIVEAHFDKNSKVIKEKDKEKIDSVNKIWEANKKNTVKLNDTGIQYTSIFGYERPKYRVFELGKENVYVDERYLLDKKNLELYSDGKSQLSQISIRRNGEQIGVVMPVFVQKEEHLTDKKIVKKIDTTQEKQQKQELKENKKTKEKDNDKLQDAGEFLKGNRKLDTSLTWNDLEAMNDLVRAKNTTKAKIYPAPKYEDLISEGYSEYASAIIINVYKKMNAKPASGYTGKENEKLYVDMVNETMKTIKDYIKENPENFTLEVLEERTGSKNHYSYHYKYDDSLFKAVFPDKENKKPYNIFRAYPEYNRRALIVGGSKFTESLKLDYYTLKDINKVLEEVKTAKEEKTGEKVKKQEWEKDFSIVEPDRWNNKYSIASKKTKKILAEYSTKEEALNAVIKVYNEIKRIKAERKKANYERKYVERRENGKNITPEELKEVFGFRGVNFGNWVNQKERQDFVNYTYDSLFDLAELLNLPPKAMSLEGELGIAFGAQGHGGKASAHYIPAYKEINLTKESGAGALAHEWWHALDNYFGNKATSKDFSEEFALSLKNKGEIREELYNSIEDLHDQIMTTPFTEEELEENLQRTKDRINENIKRYAEHIKNHYKKSKNIEEINKIVDNLVENKEKYKEFSFDKMQEITNKFFKLVPDNWNNRGEFSWLTSEILRLAQAKEIAKSKVKYSEYYKNAIKLDQIEGKKTYWAEDTELGARAFSSYLLDKMNKQAIVNQFLASPNEGVSLNPKAFKQLADNLEPNEKEPLYIPHSPTNKEERARIFKAFDKLFETIQTKETDKGIELYMLDKKNKIYKFNKEMLDNSDNVSKYWNYKKSNFNEVVNKLGLEDVIEEINNFAEFYCKNLSLDIDIKSILKEKAENLKITGFNNNNYGVYGKNTIKISKTKSDKLPVFVMALSHEYWHNVQEEIEYEILQIPEAERTYKQNKFIEEVEKSNDFYKEKATYLKKHPKIKTILKNILKIKEESKKIKYILSLNKIDYIRYKYFVKEILPKYDILEKENEAFEIGNYFAKGYDSGQRDVKILARNRKPNISSNKIRRYYDVIRRRRRGRGNSKEEELSDYSSNIPDNIDYSKYNQKAKDYIREWYSDIEKNRYDVNKTLNSFINITKAIAKEYSKNFGMKVNDKQIREILPFLRERTGLPERLERPDLKAIFDKLNGKEKERLTKLADDTSAKFEKYYKEYQEAKGVESENDIENHISHIWDLDKKQKSLLTNYFTTSSRFAKNRTIDTLVKGIDGFEVNGETIYFKPKTLDYAEILKSSSDSFIKATSDMILADRVKNMEAKIGNGKKGEKLVLPSHKAPADWVEFNHPALNKSVYLGGDVDVALIGKRPVKVHPEIAKTLKTVFETPATQNAFLNVFDKANSVYKQSQLGFSGFHMVALSESMMGNIGITETVKLLNPVRMYDEIAKGNWGVYKEDTIAKQAIEDGLQLGATLDLDRGTVEKIADDVTSWTEKIPVVGKYFKHIPKVIGKAQRLNNQILWDYLHNNYKLECYKLYSTQEAERLGRALTKAERREIAQWVNDSFGGQVWENLGIAPSQRRTEQRVLLSPDWLRSTTRQFLAMLSTEKGSKFLNEKAKENNFWKNAKEIAEEWGINSNTEDIGSSSLRGRISRAFWLRAIIYSSVLYNMMNAFFRYRDKEEHPEYYPKNMTFKDYSIYSNKLGNEGISEKLMPYVFIGRNSDGTERYLRLGKQFREMPELLEKPLEKLGGKASPVVQIGSQILTGHTASGFKNQKFYGNTYATKDVMKKGWERVGESTKLLGTSLAPFSLNSAFNPYMDTTAWSLFAPVSKGMTKGKGKEAFIEAYKKSNKNEIEVIRQSLKRNGFDNKEIKTIEKKAITEFSKPYIEKYEEALSKKDNKKVLKVQESLNKTNLSNADKRKIYTKALDEYLKNRK